MVRLQSALIDPRSFATTLVTAAWDRFGSELTEWDPETVALELKTEFGVTLPRRNFDRLMAAIKLLTTDEFYQKAASFITLCNILSGDAYDPEVWDPADPEELAWGITEALILAPPPEEIAEPFSAEVRKYIAAALDEAGLMTAPDVLRIALRQSEPITRVQSDWFDDPETFDALWDVEKTRTEEIESLLRLRISVLQQQLRTLDLQNRQAPERTA